MLYIRASEEGGHGEEKKNSTQLKSDGRLHEDRHCPAFDPARAETPVPDSLERALLEDSLRLGPEDLEAGCSPMFIHDEAQEHRAFHLPPPGEPGVGRLHPLQEHRRLVQFAHLVGPVRPISGRGRLPRGCLV